MRVPPDNSDVVVWRLNDGAAPFVNSSTSADSLGSAANLVTVSGTVIMDARSVFNEPCVYFPASGTWPAGASGTKNRLETTTGAGLRVNAPMSVSGWIKVRNFANLGDNYGWVFKKNSRPNQTWTTPYSALDFIIWNSTDGKFRFSVTTASGTRNEVATDPNNFVVPTGVWSHVGLTYDGTTLRGYINGLLVATLATNPTGAIDWTTDGAWTFGSKPEEATPKQEGAFMACDWRIANVARGLSYFQQIYRRGVLTW
jgi:hypothetical protein